MTVIVRCPDQTVKVYTKGAVMLIIYLINYFFFFFAILLTTVDNDYSTFSIGFHALQALR